MTTMVTLKEYLESRLTSQEKELASRFAASEKAVLVAESNAQKWRDNANEWRDAMNDREKTFAKAEQVQALKERLDLLSGEKMAHKETKEDGRAVIAAAIAIVLALISLVASFIRG